MGYPLETALRTEESNPLQLLNKSGGAALTW